MIKKLLSPEVQKFIKDHLNDDPFLLSLHTKKSDSFPLTEAIEQIQSYQKAESKMPSWSSSHDVIWPPPISIEQASSEATAKFKSTLIRGNSLADLSGGMGIDTSYFASQFQEIHYVESSQQLCDLAAHNFLALGKNNVSIHCQTSDEFLKVNTRKFDAFFIDPSRRQEDKKVFKISDCSPNLYETIPLCLNFSSQILVKLSPLVDLSLLIKEFQPSKIWVVGLKNEVKEVLCLIQNDTKPAKIHAVDLNEEGLVQAEFDFYQHEEAQAKSEYAIPQKFLYEPSPVLLKTGAFKLIGQYYKLKKLHQHSHLYTSDELIEDFPGKILRIVAQLKPNKKEIAKIFPDNKVHVITRNYPLSANQLKGKFKLKDGGEDFLIATTLMDGKKGLFRCKRVS